MNTVLARARGGDDQAFGELTDPYRRELELHCYRILGSVQDAEDMLQETLLAAWRGLSGYEGRASVRTWLYRIATNPCLNALRASGRRPPASPEPPFVPPEPSGSPPRPPATTSTPSSHCSRTTRGSPCRRLRSNTRDTRRLARSCGRVPPGGAADTTGLFRPGRTGSPPLACTCQTGTCTGRMGWWC